MEMKDNKSLQHSGLADYLHCSRSNDDVFSAFNREPAICLLTHYVRRLQLTARRSVGDGTSDVLHTPVVTKTCEIQEAMMIKRCNLLTSVLARTCYLHITVQRSIRAQQEVSD